MLFPRDDSKWEKKAKIFPNKYQKSFGYYAFLPEWLWIFKPFMRNPNNIYFSLDVIDQSKETLRGRKMANEIKQKSINDSKNLNEMRNDIHEIKQKSINDIHKIKEQMEALMAKVSEINVKS